MSELDRALMARVLGMLGSASPGERDNAARMAERIRCDAGLTWSDIVAPTVDADGVAAEAARILLAENEALLAELEEPRPRLSPRRSAGLEPRQSGEMGARHPRRRPHLPHPF
jgi:hypothetical protein